MKGSSISYFGIGSDSYSIDYNNFQQSYNTFGDDFDCFSNTYNQFNENYLSFDSPYNSFSETYGFKCNYLNYTPSYEYLKINLNTFQSFCHDTYDNFGDAANPLDDADLLSNFDYDLYRSYNEPATNFNYYDGIETVDISSFGCEEDSSVFSVEPSAINSPPASEAGLNFNNDAINDPMPTNDFGLKNPFGILNDLDMQPYSFLLEQNNFNTEQNSTIYPYCLDPPGGGTYCPPSVPLSPSGVDIDWNIAKTEVMGGAVLWFYNQVRNRGPWDYKQLGSQYQDFGNFNFGATGAALGIPDQILLRGAGWAEEQAGTSEQQTGHWWSFPPMEMILQTRL